MTNDEKVAFFAMLDKHKMNPTIIPSSPTVPRDRISESKTIMAQSANEEKDPDA